MLVDQRDSAAIDGATRQVAERFGRVDILVNNAAWNIGIPLKNLDALTADVWDRVLETDRRNPFLLARALAPHLRQHGCGRIVNIASPAALQEAAQWAATAGPGGWVFTAVFWLVPLWMAFVTVSAKMPANRWANLVGGTLLTLLNIYHFFVCAVPLLQGGPYAEPTAQHILLVGSTVVATGLVTWFAWTWPQREA